MKIQKRIEINLDKPGFSYPVKVVQYDTGIQLIFTISNFEIPDGTTVTVFFLKPSGKFVYQEKNITISGNEITVDVENQAFAESGVVEYQVKLTNGDDLITSFSRIVQVEKSLADSGAEESKTVIAAFDTLTAEKIADIQAAALDEIAAAKQAIEARGEEVLATIPADYTEMGNNVDYLFNEAANAIKNNLSGSVIAVNDVSPLKHKPIVRAHGKNLITVADVVTGVDDNIYISEAGEGYLVVTSVSEYNGNGYCQTFKKLEELCPQLEVGKTYVISALTEPVAWFKCIYLKEISQFWYFNQTLTITEEMLSSHVVFYGLNSLNNQGTGDCRIYNIQVEEGETVTEYTPYIDPTTVTVRYCGKNVFPEIPEQTANGVTLSKVNNYYVLNGTATGSGLFTVTSSLQAGTITLSANNPKHNSLDLAIVQIYSDSLGLSVVAKDNAVNSEYTAEIETAIDYQFRIRYENGVTYNNFVVKPQLEYAEASSEYEAYNGANYTPIEDGSIEGITSVSPNMTIFANTAGIIVDCEYNVDTKKYIDNSKSTGVLLTDTVTGKVYELKITDGHVVAEGVS